MLARLDVEAADPRNAGKRLAECVAYDQKLIRRVDRLIKRFSQGASAGVVHVDHGAGELGENQTWFHHRSTGTGRAVPKEFGQRRVTGLCEHPRAEAGQR